MSVSKRTIAGLIMTKSYRQHIGWITMTAILSTKRNRALPTNTL